MPGVHRSNDDGYQAIARIVRKMQNRIEDLERKTKKAKRSSGEEIAVFSVVGDMAVSTSSPYRVRQGGQIVGVAFDAKAAGSGSTTFDVLDDTAAVGSTVTVASGTTSTLEYIGNVRVAAGSLLQIDLTAAGMHEGAVIQVVMKG